ncbi:phosphate ABC transporter substrate-binding protein PstS [Terracidiphilus gabretensis]|uniref:phosphate ABC transporter substrate-binding protein PstS n=1 Tax=Terracidiphilus gabretensis TaxID=1577687 RepID=UPI000A5F96B7|nr:phosphate ABC transporter substrate-binding protein PstS [Terracidiphilus gabretensis]
MLNTIFGRIILAVAALAVVLPSFAQSAAPAQLHTIHVEGFGQGSNAAALRDRVVERLNHSGQIQVVDNASASDAVLRGDSNIWATGSVVMNPRSSASRQTDYQGYLSLELVDKNNQPLWSYLVTPSRFRTDGIMHDLADHGAERLIDAVRSGSLRADLPAAGATKHVALRAAGATLPQVIYLKWFKSAGMAVSYYAVGSDGGIEQLAAGKVDFAASDMPVTPETASASVAVTNFPTLAGGVVPIYNLAGVSGSLRFTPQVLAGIYSGAIHCWNDSRIRAANGGQHLPDAEITVVHRSDGSGTTFVWTSYLSLVSPGWKAGAGSGTHVIWPVGTGAQGSDGIAAMVQKTPNSIGYVELIYAIQHELNYAAVENPAGQFIKADLASITAAAQFASENSEKGFRFSILNAPGKSAYPISTLTWLLVPSQGLDGQKKEAVSSLLRWMLTAGQKDCGSLGYAPLPREVAVRALREVDGLK